MTKPTYEKELKKLTNQIVTKYKPEKMILFGSLANGKARKGSDIDLLVIKKTKKNYWQRCNDLVKIVDIDLPSDILIITPKELKYRLSIGDYFIEDIIDEGKMIYEKK